MYTTRSGLAAESDLGDGPRGGRLRHRAGGALRFLGPAFVAAVAYVDPGNFATNVTGGAQYGYLLLWVVVLANVMAMLVQYLSAKLGLATGRNLPEVCRERYGTRTRIALWLQAELVVVMTDLAEVVGGAIGLNLLFGLPLPIGGVITAGGMFLVMLLQGRGRRGFEAVIIGLLVVVLAAFVYQLFRVRLDPAGIAGGLVPSFAGTDSILLAVGIVGATVMPHAIYLHSSLTRGLAGSGEGAKKRALKITAADVVCALGLAGVVNVAMLLGATSLTAAQGESLFTAQAAFSQNLGQLAGMAFGIALVASGLAASSVGVYSGQVVMQGFIKRSIPMWLRRSVSILPAVAILVIGVDPTQALVISQVVLSFGIPFALIPLVRFTNDRDLMGPLVNRRGTAVLAVAVAALITGLNVYLIVTTFLG
jgi:manganese transport protein